ncbi:ISL3 family transposase [Tessaracoccus antarcticus]|uniref:ISL3 family transposase n=1 Tax=Tessaracoccus antarcticus TaxID=2479848 RepID=A0A3M0G5C1_9ACTN|nr:ISL3 family transposase [Tessaracoccus antarcticus]RMB60240.1 ISL3 family transposase [Tessaracoccus antarcticus]
MRNATPPCLDQFCRLDRLGLSVVAQRVEPGYTMLSCVPTTAPTSCPVCGQPGGRHDTVVRRVAHVPFRWKPTILEVLAPRYRCRPCGRIWRHNLQAAAPSRSKLSRDAITLAVKSVVIDRMSIARIAANLGVAWKTAHDAILASAAELLINDPDRLDGVTTVGVDEHVWRHTRFGGKYVTVIIDLTPTRTGTGPSRLLAVVEGRSKKAFKTWLEAQTQQFRKAVEVVAMDGFTGYKSAAVEAIEKVKIVMDPFHVVALAGTKLDECRQRLQQETLGHRGRSGDPLYGIRRAARTRAGLLTEKQHHRLAAVFANEDHVAFEVTWSVYQRVIDAYQAEKPATGKKLMTDLIKSIHTGVPNGLPEVRILGRTMQLRRDDIVAYFDHPGTSNGPSEAINGLLEHLRGTARGFRNLTHYIARCLLDAGGFMNRSGLVGDS